MRRRRRPRERSVDVCTTPTWGRRALAAIGAVALCGLALSSDVDVVHASWVDAAHAGVSIGSPKWAVAATAFASVGDVDALDKAATLSSPGPHLISGATGSASISDGTVRYVGASTSAKAGRRVAASSASVQSLDVVPTGYSAGSLTLTSTDGVIAASADCRVGSASSGSLTGLATLRVTNGSTTRPAIVSGNTASFAPITVSLAGLVGVTIGPVVTRAAATVSDPADPAVSQRLTLNPGIVVTLLGATLLSLSSTITLIEASCSLDLP